MLTANAAPLATGVAKVNADPETGKLSPPLSCSTRPLPVRPETEPPIVNVDVVQVTATEITFPVVTVPDAVFVVTVHVCAGLDGCTSTLTEYAPPLAMALAWCEARSAPAVTVTLSERLSCRMTDPLRPEMLPLYRIRVGGWRRRRRRADGWTSTDRAAARGSRRRLARTGRLRLDGHAVLVVGAVASGVGKAKLLLLLTVRSSPLLSWRTTDPTRPRMVPPIE